MRQPAISRGMDSKFKAGSAGRALERAPPPAPKSLEYKMESAVVFHPSSRVAAPSDGDSQDQWNFLEYARQDRDGGAQCADQAHIHS